MVDESTIGVGLVLVFCVVIGVISYSYAAERLGIDNPLNRNGASATDTVLFDMSKPKVMQKQLESYLEKNAGAKMKSIGQEMHTQGQRFNIDPAFAAAVSMMETSLGKERCDSRVPTATWAGCNNFFCLEYDRSIFKAEGDGKCGDTNLARFATEKRGVEAFYDYMQEKYIRATPTQDTVSKIGCTLRSYNSCYCAMTKKECKAWVAQVTAVTEQIRQYQP